MQLNFDAEKFIALVQSKEPIWNYKSQVYNHKEQRRNDWMAVCREMVPDFDDKTPTAKHALVTSFQRQWKVLRDGYLRSLKNMKKRGPTAKPYTFHENLTFLLEIYSQESEKDAKQSGGDSSDATDAEATPSSDSVPVVQRRAKRRTLQKRVSNEIIELRAPSPTPEEALIEKITHYIENEERAKHNSANDEDKLFLLSLLNDFKNIPEALKLDAKFDILNVLRHYRNIGNNSFLASGSKKAKVSGCVYDCW